MTTVAPTPKPNIAPPDHNRWSIGWPTKWWLFGYFRTVFLEFVSNNRGTTISLDQLVQTVDTAHVHDNKAILDQILEVPKGTPRWDRWLESE